ncbi:MAG: FG-GAP-like repeat-containing protein [Flavobacteriaceae bacterium]|nr:FG-GAP-like repeat-containing protein [Flavobacteriaceae bacterium]
MKPQFKKTNRSFQTNLTPCFFLIISFFISINAVAQENYLRNTTTHEYPVPGVSSPTTASVAIDFDLDGDMDMVYAVPDSNIVGWMENDGNQNYTNHIINVLNPQLPAVVTVADLDSDGDLDIIVGGHFGIATRLVWLVNHGNNVFTTEIVAATEGYSAWEVVDMDNDGDMDVVAIREIHNDVRWFENDGLQSFTPHVITTISNTPVDIAAIDMDNDGDMDFVVSCKGNNQIQWYKNDGSQNFTIEVIATLTGTNSVELIDMEGDGDIDVFSAGDNSIEWYRNDGSQVFTTVVITNEGNVKNVQLADLDNDGDLDVFTSYEGIKWFENDNNEHFTKRTLLCCIQGIVYIEDRISIADRDNDGDLDILTTGVSYDGNVVMGLIWVEMDMMMMNTIPSMNEQNVAVSSDIILNFNEAIDGATVNANNIVVYGNQSGKIDGTFSGGGTSTIVFNPTNDFFKGEVIHVNIASEVKDIDGYKLLGQHAFDFRTATNPYGFTPTTYIKHQISNSMSSNRTNFPVDMDNDGDMDVLSHSGTELVWLENDGSQNFTENSISVSTNDSRLIYAIDLDLDGDMDAISISIDFNTTRWFENDGNQSFTEYILPTIPSADILTGMAPADFDGDGDIDIFISFISTGKMVLYENDGNQNFTINLGDEMLGAHAGRGAVDMDLDGDMDIVTNVQDGSNPSLVWYENDGNLSGAPHPINTTSRVSSNYSVDLDGDGDIDIIAGSSSQLTWYENDGSQNFTENVIASGFFNFGFIDAMDMDGDLDIDLVVASGNAGDALYWFKNDGSQNFTQNFIDTLDGNYSAFAVDMDKDGDMDILSSSLGTNEVVWYEFSTTTIWENTAWTNGVPTIMANAIIRDNYSTTTNGGSIDAKSLVIDLGYILTIGDGNYLQVEGDITVDGSLIVEHQGSVVQVNDLATVTNNGNIEVVKTNTTFDAPTDFTIIGSPMTSETRNGVYGQNNVTMNHLTSNFIPNEDVATADPMSENFADDNGDNWQFFTGSEAIVPGVGYLVGGVTGGGSFTNTYTQGTLNNGVVTFSTIYNGTQNASPNIFSNPYASAIDASQFITNNAIVDAIYFWEHLTAPSASYPGYRLENWDMGDISIYNMSGGVAASNGGDAPTQYIPSGQGFGIKANASGDVIFDNSLRVTGPNTGYRSSNVIDRMYLTINNETYGLKSTVLIAFTPEATNGIDANYDAKRLATPISIYSIVENEELTIQGRSAFNENQIVQLGFRSQVEEEQEYTIILGDIEGELITLATIYLKDNLLYTFTNLSETEYSFTSEDGNFKNRFLIYFEEESLGTNDVVINTIAMYPNPTKDNLTITANSSITDISIFDISGRVVKVIRANGLNTMVINLSQLNTAMYFVRISTEESTTIKRVVKD